MTINERFLRRPGFLFEVSEERLATVVSLPFAALASYVLLVVLFLGPLQAFSYQPGYVEEFNEAKAVIGGLLTFVIAVLMPRKKAAPSSLFLWMVFLLIVIPRFVVFGCRDLSWQYPLTVAALFVIALGCNTLMKDYSVPGFFSQDRTLRRVRSIGLVLIVSVLALQVVYFLATKGAPSLAAFNFDHTYEIRASSQLSQVATFANSLFGAYLVPLLIVYSFAKGNLKNATLLTLWELVMFLWTANKGWLLILALLWGLYLFKRKNRLTIHAVVWVYTSFLLLLTIAICGLGVGSSILSWVFTLFVRRLIFVPSILGYSYFDFFQAHDPVLLQNTIFSFLTPMPDEYSVVAYQNSVGVSAFGTADSWANTGLFGAEYAQAGVFSAGIILIDLCILLFFLHLGSANPNTGGYLAYAAALFSFTLINASSVRLLFSPTGIITMALFLLLLTTLSPLPERGERFSESRRR